VPPRVIGIAPGTPFAVDTFSGISRGLLGALRDLGMLAGAVDGRPRWLERMELAASADVDRVRWRQQFYAGTSPASLALREATSRVAERRARTVDGNATLQLTGWYRVDLPGHVSASFHDGNLAATLQRPDLRIDRASRRVRRALAWERSLYDRMDVILTMSGWLRETFLDTFGQDPAKVIVAGAGTDLELPADISHDWDRPRLLFVGREWERKGGPELLAAWPAVRAQLPGAELIIAGPSALDDLPAGVSFVGRIDRSTGGGEERFRALYREATAFVLPSRFEPFGIVLLEAMAYGLPCVAADRNAMPEIVADGTSGRVVDPTDPDAFAAALVDALQHPGWGAAGRRRVEERFNWHAVARTVVDAISARAAGPS
jgi:glycosyltransferase involved in cell wall biosynthesis